MVTVTSGFQSVSLSDWAIFFRMLSICTWQDLIVPMKSYEGLWRVMSSKTWIFHHFQASKMLKNSYDVLLRLMMCYEGLWRVMRGYDVLWRVMREYEGLWGVMRARVLAAFQAKFKGVRPKGVGPTFSEIIYISGWLGGLESRVATHQFWSTFLRHHSDVSASTAFGPSP